MKIIIEIPEKDYVDCKRQVALIGEEGWMYSPKHNFIINKGNGVEFDELHLKSYISNGVLLEEEIKKIKTEIKQSQNLYYYNKKTDTYEDIIKTDTVLKIIDNRIE